MKWSYFLIWDETIVWEHWMFLLNNENTEYFTLHLKSWMIFFLFVCLKSTVLIVDCFHLLVLYAIFILTSPKLCKGKKRRERSGDCTATKPSLLCSLSTPDWKKKVPQKRSGFRRDKEARWYISQWGMRRPLDVSYVSKFFSHLYGGQLIHIWLHLLPERATSLCFERKNVGAQLYSAWGNAATKHCLEEKELWIVSCCMSPVLTAANPCGWAPDLLVPLVQPILCCCKWLKLGNSKKADTKRSCWCLWNLGCGHLLHGHTLCRFGNTSRAGNTKLEQRRVIFLQWQAEMIALVLYNKEEEERNVPECSAC